MRLTLIAANNIKGRAFSHALHPVTMIVGPNESGKTSILDAISLLSQDFRTDLRGNKILPAALASGQSMRIHGKTDTGLTPFKNYEKGRLVSGTEMPMPAAILDSRAYFGLSGPARTKFIFDAFPSAETRESLISQVAQLIPDEPSDAWEAGLKAVLEELRKESSLPFHSWLNDKGDSVKVMKNMARAAADRMAKTIEGLASLDELYPVNDANEEDLKAEAAKLQEEDGGLREHLGSLKQRAVNAKKLAAARSVLPQRLHSLEAARLAITNELNAITAAETLLNGMNPMSDMAASIKRIQLINGEGQRNKGAIDSELKASLARKAMLMANDACPMCQQPLKEKEAAIQLLDSQIKEAEERLAVIDLNLKANAAKVRELNAAVNSRQEAEANLRSLKANLPHLEEKARSLQDEIDRFPAPEDSVNPIDGQILIAEAKLAAVQKERGSLTLTLEQFGLRKNEEQRRQQALVQAAVGRATDEACGATLKVLQTMRAKVVQKTFETLVKTSRAVTDGIICHELAFDGGEIGAVVEGKWVGHDTFSGLQQAVTYLAVCASFAKPEERIVILDEMTRLDLMRKRQFIVRVTELVRDGVLSQFIGVDTLAEPYMIEGVHLIQTGI